MQKIIKKHKLAASKNQAESKILAARENQADDRILAALKSQRLVKNLHL